MVVENNKNSLVFCDSRLRKKGKSKDYNKLLPLESGSENESDIDEPKESDRLADPPDVEIPKPDLRFKNGRQNGTAYNFVNKSNNKDKFCTPTRAAVIFATILFCFGIGYIAGFLTPSTILKFGDQEKIIHKRSAPWRTKFSDWGTESCIRLVDVDGDGLLDVIMGLALGKDVSSMITESSMGQFCKDLGMEQPCAGAIVALRGYDGKLLWKTKAYAEIFALNCHGVDANKDGTFDCIATGRLADIRVINPKNGELLWEGDGSIFNRGWNIYSTNVIPDMDYDGVNEIVLAHGGDPVIPANVHVRHSGWLMMISGGTGKQIGRQLEMPEDKETYMSPVIHERRDGSQYILFGSGGETVGGLFMAISVPDFYRHVKQLPRNHPVPNVRGKYDQWGYKEPDSRGIIELFRAEVKGVMVPPVLVDVNKDGVNDIFMNSFDGAMVLFDGETLKIMWKVKLEERESYSSPAPGYFNDDDVIDFMLHWSKGEWPFYNNTDVIILDGKDGTVLWNLTSNRYDVSSDLVAKTDDKNRDVFFFRVQGRNGQDPRPVGAIHGATGIQRVVNKRGVVDGSIELEDKKFDESDDNAGILLPEMHVRHKRRVMDKDYIECESDQTVFLTELFAVDRTTMRKPLKIWEKGAEKFYYRLTENDKKLVEAVMKKYGKNHTMTENEVPWSRGKRNAGKPFCLMSQPDERTTDEFAHFVKMKFDTDVYKLNLDDAIASGIYTPINVTVHPNMRTHYNEERLSNIQFLPQHLQTWGGYMGTYGDSVY
ncbi:hypothetical protein KUTeg_023184 [Tegillarca granosa]|uniref:FAM234A/B beta-propeller domain-containing protein n=1 Tax=Tegillarca granosa TaxID=220873 RepID=A0ABQ9E1A7_TEGGR|nr:hypothetical protein KUTeg_023184 [Tegillarca granosa]